MQPILLFSIQVVLQLMNLLVLKQTLLIVQLQPQLRQFLRPKVVTLLEQLLMQVQLPIRLGEVLFLL